MSQSQVAPVKLQPALVLMDLPAHACRAGQILEADPDLIKALQAAGQVDAHRAAVKHASEQGARTVRSAAELAAESRALRVAEIKAALSADQALSDDPELDDAARRGIVQRQAALTAELSALG